MTVLALHRHMRKPRGGAAPVVLVDGSPLVLRAATAARQDDLEDLFLGMSAASRWFRFLTGTSRLPAGVLAHLADVDQRDHVAWLVYDGDVCVAEARYVRLSADRATAEVALAITDRWQGRGLGRVLVQHLARQAVADGVVRFTCTVDVENHRALWLLRSLGMRGRSAGGVHEGELLLERGA